MAGLTKEQRAAKAAEQNSQQAAESHLIAVSKGGETLHVHPACLADHKRLGWKEA
jgi:hypothetical protein